jgi:ATP-dependent Lon protease
LREELGESEQEEENIEEIENLKKKILDSKLPASAEEKALEVLNKLKRIPSISPDFAVERNYIDLLLQLPWNNSSEDNLDLGLVRTILDEDHYDLEKPKERILDFIAILNLTKNIKRQIICFVGPPGTGKTSLAKSIARSLDRKFIRVALGGIKDEAEIRGHRRTYIGALPGKIINAVKKAGTNNPVILLDEIDKLSFSYHGDPASALLEVLDPEQNSTFTDHYLEVEWDLSKVLFITTANVYYDIPLPLLDRMEVIEVSSYLDFQKVEIAKTHIIPKIQKEFGLEEAKIHFNDDAILKIIRNYTKEPGVRELERQISTVLRKVAREFLTNVYQKPMDDSEANSLQNQIKNCKMVITEKTVVEYLKIEKYKEKTDELKNQIGLVNGLAWTSVGGEILPVEVTIMNGPEKLTLTGKLGEVMRESAVAGLSYIRSNATKFNIKSDFFKGKEIHVHIPEGAIPKDGPSAGITMTLAILSSITQTYVRGDIAMTGEITLRGNVLPIGGLREKLLAAKKARMRTVIIPKENETDLVEIQEFIKEGLEIISVTSFNEVTEIAFLKKSKKAIL